MLNRQELSLFKSEGYLRLKGFFPKRKIAEVLNDAKSIFFRQMLHLKYLDGNIPLKAIGETRFNQALYRMAEEKPDILFNCGKQVQHLVSLHALSLSKAVINLLKTFGMPNPNISTRPTLFFNHPKLAKKEVYYKISAHQDWRSMQGSLNSAVVWLPLVKMTKELGPLEIIPRSHIRGLITSEVRDGFGLVSADQFNDKDFVSIEMEIGDILVFSSFLVHRSGENLTDRPRWSCHFRYNDLDEFEFIERGYPHAYIYRPVEKLLTPNYPINEALKKHLET